MDSLIKKIVNSKKLHAKWINTLSYLEHIGSRKIMKSQDSLGLNLEMLQHIAEEARHSYFLKKIGQKNFPSDCPNFEEQYLLGGPASKDYIQKVDDYVTERLNKVDHKILNYLYVTLLVEKRALKVYEIYDSVLVENKIDIKLSSLYAEEVKHLSETTQQLEQNDPDFKNREIEFLKDEEILFNVFLSSIKVDVNNSYNLSESCNAV